MSQERKTSLVGRVSVRKHRKTFEEAKGRMDENIGRLLRKQREGWMKT